MSPPPDDKSAVKKTVAGAAAGVPKVEVQAASAGEPSAKKAKPAGKMPS